MSDKPITDKFAMDILKRNVWIAKNSDAIAMAINDRRPGKLDQAIQNIETEIAAIKELRK